eukprot:TRINITY_DN1897_c0_g1_i5.p1 TRINITY_DN1897_c0_g1~~TRINITY_DN1897_c0_g1_i5.p1  ORF type:complete len:658 (+),score=197.99 TRINITY_DN1897_c0_g1_i5:44-2017(+)
MGIPKYAEWIHNEHPESFCDPAALAEATHVYVDFNHFLHLASNRVKARRRRQAPPPPGGAPGGLPPGGGASEAEVARVREEQFGGAVYPPLIRMIKAELDGVVRAFCRSPGLRSVYVGIDGAASRPKVLLSRQRRRAKARRGDLLSMGLTPGTALIRRIERDLAAHCAQLAARRGVEVTLDPTDVPGEAEHKILRAIQRRAAAGAAPERHVLVGSDADLYPITLAAYGVLSEGADGLPRGDVVLHHVAPVGRVFSAAKLMRSLSARCGAAAAAPAQRQLRRDFVLLSLVSGNDYLPSAGPVGPVMNRYCAAVAAAGGAPPPEWGIVSVRQAAAPTRHGFHANGTLEASLPKPHPPRPDAAGPDGDAPDAVAVVKGGQYLASLLWVMDMYANGHPLDCHFDACAADDAQHAVARLAAGALGEVAAPAGGGAALGNPISATTQAVASIPVDSLRYLLCTESYAAVAGLLDEAHPVFGWVVKRERDAELDGLREAHAGNTRAFQEWNEACKQAGTGAAGEALQARRSELKEAMAVSSSALAAHLARYRGRDIDAVDLAALDACIRPRAPAVEFERPVAFAAPHDPHAAKGGKGRGRGRGGERYAPYGTSGRGRGGALPSSHEDSTAWVGHTPTGRGRGRGGKKGGKGGRGAPHDSYTPYW